MITAFNHEHFVGIQRLPTADKVVHIFDMDDTITKKPDGFDNTGMSKDDFFDASRHFAPDTAVTWLLKYLANRGDAIAICTARPPERLSESYQWLRKWNIPFDVLMLSTGQLVSGMAKQHMIKYLQKQYRRVGTMFDDSPYNIEGARLQNVPAVHIRKNCEYWDAHPELITKVS